MNTFEFKPKPEVFQLDMSDDALEEIEDIELSLIEVKDETKN